MAFPACSNLIFEYLKKKELQLTNIGSTDIVDTNMKVRPLPQLMYLGV
jgi:hypothetical protein